MSHLDEEVQAVKLRIGIIGNSPKLNYAIQIAIQVAPTDLTVLITGESGSGKESFSKIIHELSPRKKKGGKFIAINCGGIPQGTMESELFGHEKGSFTGAVDARKGYFEVANGGTIFLDEIGEMPLETQAKLLRVLENKEFYRVGSSQVQKTDVRVVAATNVNLLEKVEKGKFREDLYYRLSTVPIYVPSLRERGNDIELLFKKFAADFAEKYHVKPITLTPDAQEILLRYRFPGNIRQLKNIVEQMSALQLERTINAETIRKYIPDYQGNYSIALLSKNNHEENFSERDILYKVLFDLKKDVTELKKLVMTILQEGSANGKKILQENAHLFRNLDGSMALVSKEEPRNETPKHFFLDGDIIKPAEPLTLELDKVEDVTPQEPEEETLSLEKKEKEMILKALKKNNHRRKQAAEELGISERTLYRKIKQYGIEE
ncbi:MAG: sigma-54 dependent transcriptional regulator [Flammeovirgaceae bacterium]|nr:sigma-54 dependent transcriptional regulator [Flammeovirgaceae bacterium]MDW8286907.1 sigma-54 dependent transcriptional regulator [Flammeovirgaceae bacterium]